MTPPFAAADDGTVAELPTSNHMTPTDGVQGLDDRWSRNESDVAPSRAASGALGRTGLGSSQPGSTTTHDRLLCG